MKNRQEISARIAEIKSELQLLGDLRPGSLTRQYKDSKNKTGGFYQINYMHKMKSKSDYVKKEFVETMEEQVNEYRKFKLLINEWVELGIMNSKLQMKTNERKKNEN
ncbi:MAG: DUF6788 family protein [Lentisphaerota bacterium]